MNFILIFSGAGIIKWIVIKRDSPAYYKTANFYSKVTLGPVICIMFLKVYFMCLSSHMNTFPLKVTFFLILSTALLGVFAFRTRTLIMPLYVASATPTYDPFVETPLPPNPTELELGQNLYWHWCMPCHGDKGQGLTDEFRGKWEPDHQNCWARGCHTGYRDEEGFPIPTVVPGLVGEDHLSQFSSLQEFASFLKATHPPQSPGVLKDEEYHAIALFVFTMNGRAIEDAIPATVPVSTPTVTSTQTPSPALITESTTGLNPSWVGAIAVVAVVLGLVLLGRSRIQAK
jgi:hypothetical protein